MTLPSVYFVAVVPAFLQHRGYCGIPSWRVLAVLGKYPSICGVHFCVWSHADLTLSILFSSLMKAFLLLLLHSSKLSKRRITIEIPITLLQKALFHTFASSQWGILIWSPRFPWYSIIYRCRSHFLRTLMEDGSSTSKQITRRQWKQWKEFTLFGSWNTSWCSGVISDINFKDAPRTFIEINSIIVFDHRHRSTHQAYIHRNNSRIHVAFIHSASLNINSELDLLRFFRSIEQFLTNLIKGIEKHYVVFL